MERLMQKALPARDALALKLIRNLACNGGPAVGQHFIPFLDDMVAILQAGASMQEDLRLSLTALEAY